ncbi:site-specific integrase [Bradyrhizobium sp. WSM1417]|uniref:tyrosine-type recombinase/integrase n=1 Tax=Bradyrhizobium sp. WSM1417 TaxID=754500 RepID=UPI0004AC87B7|nr:site-specific integrase [Bradyrhizobium sp. WSM1417]
MLDYASAGASLFEQAGGRKYLNAAERRRFAKAAARAKTDIRLFCLTLSLSGGRISEVLALTPVAVDLDACAVTIRTLKRRKPGIVRQVPLPRGLIHDLDRAFGIRERQRDPLEATRRLWRWSRMTAWRRVKEVMALADITRTAAMPKGLRHGFGVNAIANLVPQSLVQRWLGHASPKTTAIYCDVCGPDERDLAERMWKTAYRKPVDAMLEQLGSVWRALASCWRTLLANQDAAASSHSHVGRLAPHEGDRNDRLRRRSLQGNRWMIR